MTRLGSGPRVPALALVLIGKARTRGGGGWLAPGAAQDGPGAARRMRGELWGGLGLGLCLGALKIS